MLMLDKLLASIKQRIDLFKDPRDLFCDCEKIQANIIDTLDKVNLLVKKQLERTQKLIEDTTDSKSLHKKAQCCMLDKLNMVEDLEVHNRLDDIKKFEKRRQRLLSLLKGSGLEKDLAEDFCRKLETKKKDLQDMLAQYSRAHRVIEESNLLFTENLFWYYRTPVSE